MRHPDEGVLRRLVDDRLAAPRPVRDHVAACPECRGRLEAIREDAALAARLLSAEPPTPATDRAWTRFERNVSSERSPAVSAGWRPRIGRGYAVAIAVGAAAAIAVAFTPAGSYASSLLTIFQPTTLQAVPVPTSGVGQLAALKAFGRVAAGKGSFTTVSNQAAASAASGMTVLLPTSLPAGFESPTFHVEGKATSSFTFSAAKAEQVAAKLQKTLPPMPANLDGTTVTATYGPTVLVTYGAKGHVSQLTIGQMRAPTVTSNGASLKTMESYLLSLPGIPASVKAEIQAIKNPGSTLPVPVPEGSTTTENVNIQGANGLLVSGTSGIASGVVWEAHGTIYGVEGTLSKNALLKVARSLK